MLHADSPSANKENGIISPSSAPPYTELRLELLMMPPYVFPVVLLETISQNSLLMRSLSSLTPQIVTTGFNNKHVGVPEFTAN